MRRVRYSAMVSCLRHGCASVFNSDPACPRRAPPTVKDGFRGLFDPILAGKAVTLKSLEAYSLADCLPLAFAGVLLLVHFYSSSLCSANNSARIAQRCLLAHSRHA